MWLQQVSVGRACERSRPRGYVQAALGRPADTSCGVFQTHRHQNREVPGNDLARHCSQGMREQHVQKGHVGLGNPRHGLQATGTRLRRAHQGHHREKWNHPKACKQRD